MGAKYSILAFFVVVLAGMGYVPGVLVAALVLGLLQSFAYRLYWRAFIPWPRPLSGHVRSPVNHSERNFEKRHLMEVQVGKIEAPPVSLARRIRAIGSSHSGCLSSILGWQSLSGSGSQTEILMWAGLARAGTLSGDTPGILISDMELFWSRSLHHRHP